MGQACRADIWSKVVVFAKYAENQIPNMNPLAEKISQILYDSLLTLNSIYYIKIFNKEILPWKFVMSMQVQGLQQISFNF